LSNVDQFTLNQDQNAQQPISFNVFRHQKCFVFVIIRAADFND